MTDLFDEMAQAWGTSVVTRSELKKFSGGILNPRTIANLDSMGIGISNRFRCGKHVVYPVTDVVQFLRERAREVE